LVRILGTTRGSQHASRICRQLDVTFHDMSSLCWDVHTCNTNELLFATSITSLSSGTSRTEQFVNVVHGTHRPRLAVRLMRSKLQVENSTLVLLPPIYDHADRLSKKQIDANLPVPYLERNPREVRSGVVLSSKILAYASCTPRVKLGKALLRSDIPYRNTHSPPASRASHDTSLSHSIASLDFPRTKRGEPQNPL